MFKQLLLSFTLLLSSLHLLPMIEELTQVQTEQKRLGMRIAGVYLPPKILKQILLLAVEEEAPLKKVWEYGKIAQTCKTFNEILQDTLVAFEERVLEQRNPLKEPLACIAAHVGAIRWLKSWIQQKEVNVNVKGKNGNTLLYKAVLHGHTEIVKLLLKHNANVNVKNRWGDTPLHVAVIHCGYISYIEIIKLLIEHQADVNAKDEYDTTPLFWAKYGYKPSRLIALLENAAKAKLKSE